MKKIIGEILVFLYIIIAVFVTVCLLSYNDFKVTEFGESSLIIIDNNELEPRFSRGDLVIANGDDKISVGDEIFFYNVYFNKEIEVSYGKVTNEEKLNAKEKTYTIEGEHQLSSEYVIGPLNSCTVMPNVGTILGILESKWGFLFLIVFPSLLAFIYEIGVVVSDIKNNKE